MTTNLRTSHYSVTDVHFCHYKPHIHRYRVATTIFGPMDIVIDVSFTNEPLATPTEILSEPCNLIVNDPNMIGRLFTYRPQECIRLVKLEGDKSMHVQ